MTDPLLDPDQALDRLAAWKDRIDRQAAETQAMSDRVGALRITATNDTRAVEVTVDAQGVLIDLKLEPSTRRLEPDALARAILATHQKARRRAAAQVRQVLDETIGADSPVGRAVLREDR